MSSELKVNVRGDVRAAILEILEDSGRSDWSAQRIAEAVGCNDGTVYRVRKEWRESRLHEVLPDPDRPEEPTEMRLSRAEDVELRKREAIIGRWLEEGVRAGEALEEIRDARLYREINTDFDTYCSIRWSMTGRTAYRMIAAAKVARNLAGLALPGSQGALLALADLDPARQREVWEQLLGTAPDGDLAVDLVEEAVRVVLPPPPPGLNGVHTPDAVLPPLPPEYQALADAAAARGPAPEPEPPPAPPSPAVREALAEQDFLETLPARDHLAEPAMARFDRDALLWRRLEAAREYLGNLYHGVVKDKGGLYAREVERFFRCPAPPAWLPCVDCADDHGFSTGLAGPGAGRPAPAPGQAPGAYARGPCASCEGRGYVR